MAPSGGYVAGREDLVQRVSVQLSAPGVEGGATFGMNQRLFQGLFQAPAVIGESLKGALLVSAVMDRLGFASNPPGPNLQHMLETQTCATLSTTPRDCSDFSGSESLEEAVPVPTMGRTDIIQSVRLGSRERLVAFCEYSSCAHALNSMHIVPQFSVILLLCSSVLLV